MFRLVVICGCLMAVANGGLISSGLIGASAPGSISLHPSTVSLQQTGVAVPTVTSSSSNIIRGIGNLGAISASANSVDTAFSSERKADVRINNPGVQTTGILSYAASAPALAVTGTALAGPLTVATGPGLTLSGPALATSSLGLGLHGVAVNGLGVGVNGYGVGVNGYGVGVNGYGLHGVNGLGLGQLGAIRVL